MASVQGSSANCADQSTQDRFSLPTASVDIAAKRLDPYGFSVYPVAIQLLRELGVCLMAETTESFRPAL
jgi:hypothetical protein